MAACQQIKWSPGGTQQLTSWKEFQSSMSAIQVEPRRHTAIYQLEEISWQHVSKFNWRPGATQQPTAWKGFYGSMLANQLERGRHRATHLLEGIFWQHVSISTGAGEGHSNLPPGRDFMAVYQQFKCCAGNTQQLTAWMAVCQQFNLNIEGAQQPTDWKEFHSSTSAIQVEPKRHIATHLLEEIS